MRHQDRVVVVEDEVSCPRESTQRAAYGAGAGSGVLGELVQGGRVAGARERGVDAKANEGIDLQHGSSLLTEATAA
jgi:hypothetical protein